MSKYNRIVWCVVCFCLLGCSDEEAALFLKSQKEQQAAAAQEKSDAEQERIRAKRREEQNLVAFVGLGVAALIGGSSANQSASPPPPPPQSDTYSARLASMSNVSDTTRYRIGPNTPSPGASVPASGQATYSGNASMRTVLNSIDHFAIGKMELTADFAQSSFSGRIYNFLNPSDQAVSGLLTISHGVISDVDQQTYPNRDDYVNADITGNIFVNGVDTSVTGTMSGNFREGRQPEPIWPAGPGYVTGNIGLNQQSQSPIYGGFTTTRQQ